MTDEHRLPWQIVVGKGQLNRRDFVKRSAALGLALPAVSALLAACGGDDETPAPAAEATATQPITVDQNITPTAATGPTAAPAPPTTAPAAGPSGGSVTFARQVDSENLDPVIQDGNINIWVFMSMYDQLIGVADDGIGLSPRLAESWDISDDGTEYTFNLRSGVKFSDGSDMTVEDVKWSLERARDEEASPWSFTLTQVVEVTTPDESTVVLTLTEAWAPFLAQIAMFNASVISKAFAEDDTGKLANQVMGTGPFALQEWTLGQSMVLVKNEHYWEEGLPLLDEINFAVVPDGNSQILQLQGGEIDGIIGQGDLPLNRVEELRGDPNLNVISFISTYNNFMAINVRNAPLDDVKVRQALNYATDKQALIDTVLFGIGELSNSFMPNGALYWNEAQEGYPFNLERAQELMAESNSPDGFPLEFMVRAGNQQQLQIVTSLQQMWAEIGIEVDIQQLDSAVVTDRYREFDFEVILTGWTNDIIDPDQLVTYAIIPDTIENYRTGWVNDRAVELANEGRVTLDPDRRREIYHEIQAIHMEDAPFIYLYVLPYVDALRSRVKDFHHHPMGQYVLKNTYVEE
ncbi:MAG TPA: ABC transporter substrate-binding protein [Thermomicrobiales bacterium]|nr:ABC transporter substrate-binding protein [Thermomicrobiales bacterium]